jgi:UDP-N-acetylmuramate--alanine ligase
VLAEGGMDPTFVIGGRLEAAGSHAKLGQGEFIVVEADESDASFLYLQPTLAVVTNIDADHMVTYDHSLDKLKQAFVDFVQRLPFYGVVALCCDDPNVRDIMPRLTKPKTTYGFAADAEIRAVDVQAAGCRMQFRVVRAPNGRKPPDLEVTLNLAGVHNVRNALAAIAVGMEVGVPDEKIVRALSEFRGVGRRFERYGEIALTGGGAFTLIDDYGHHPAEMAATLAAVRGAFPDRRVVLAFQPHRYTRTRDLFEDFVRVLSTADALLLTDVYAAGEAPVEGVDRAGLVEGLRRYGHRKVLSLDSPQQLASLVSHETQSGDVVVLLGAGDITAWAYALPGQLESAAA